jgi:hypothetical protein
MVCAVAAVIHPSAVTRMVLVENRMVEYLADCDESGELTSEWW